MQTAGAIPAKGGATHAVPIGWDGRGVGCLFPSRRLRRFRSSEDGSRPPTTPRSATCAYYSLRSGSPGQDSASQLIRSKDKLAVADMERMHQDTLVVAAREIAPLVVAAFDARPPSSDTARAAVAALRSWDGDMRVDSAAAAVFSLFYNRVFDEIFADEMGEDLAKAYRDKARLGDQIRAVMDGHERWFDGSYSGVDGRDDIFR